MEVLFTVLQKMETREKRVKRRLHEIISSKTDKSCSIETGLHLEFEVVSSLTLDFFQLYTGLLW